MLTYIQAFAQNIIALRKVYTISFCFSKGNIVPLIKQLFINLIM